MNTYQDDESDWINYPNDIPEDSLPWQAELRKKLQELRNQPPRPITIPDDDLEFDEIWDDDFDIMDNFQDK